MTAQAYLACEGPCSTVRNRKGNGPVFTAHVFAERRKESIKLAFADKRTASALRGIRVVYACSRCGHERTWGVEEDA